MVDGIDLDKLIFNEFTLSYFAENMEKVYIEITIAPANGSAQPMIVVDIGEVESSQIPNTLRDLYTFTQHCSNGYKDLCLMIII